MPFIWSYVLIFWAAFFNALMDTLENAPAFNASIFKNWKKEFWLKEVSWKYAKKIFSWKFDGWHCAKSLMIFCLIGAMIVFRPHHQLLVHFISAGLIWNGSFNLFYKLFKNK